MYRLFFNGLKLYFAAYFNAFKFNKKRENPFSFKRVLFLTLFFPPFIVLQIIHYLGFILDDIFYSKYKDQSCNKILFIIGIPRSGTTFIHRTISELQTSTTFSTWEAIFAPAICEKKCLNLLNKIDTIVGRPINKVLNFFIRLFGDDFHNVHSVTLEAPEEDYLTLLPIGACLITLFAFPNSPELRNLTHFQSMSRPDKTAILAFYKKNIQRHLYGKNESILFLSKNAAFCTWLPELKTLFPKAKFILSIRDPKTAIPSQLNALKSARKLFGTDPNGTLTMEIIRQSFEQSYSSILNFLKSTPKGICALIQQEQLREEPELILKEALNQVTVTASNQVVIPKTKSTHPTSKKNTSILQDPIDPNLTNIYQSITDLDSTFND